MHKLPSSFPAPIRILAPDPDQALTESKAPIAEAPLLTEAGIAQATERAAAALTAPAAPAAPDAAAAAPVLLASSQQVKNHPDFSTEFYFDAPYSDNYDDFINFENSKKASLKVFIVNLEPSPNPPAKTCFGGKNSDSVNYQDTLMGDKITQSHPQFQRCHNKNVVNLYHFKTSDSQTSKEYKIFLSSNSYVELKKSMEKVKIFLDDIKSKASPPNSFDNNDFKNLNLYIRNELQKSNTKTNLNDLNGLIDKLVLELQDPNSDGIQSLKSKISPTSTSTQSPDIVPTNLTDQLFSSLLHDNFLLIENSASIVRETNISTSQINVSTYSYKFSGSITVASPDKNPTICKIENDTLKEPSKPPSIPDITHTTFEIENSNVIIKTFRIDQECNINTSSSQLNQSPSHVVVAPSATHVAPAATNTNTNVAQLVGSA
jgi:hypothetical protein